MYELWLMEVGEGRDERMLYRGDDAEEITKSVVETADEVDCNINKYYELIPFGVFSMVSQTFDTSEDFYERSKI